MKAFSRRTGSLLEGVLIAAIALAPAAISNAGSGAKAPRLVVHRAATHASEARPLLALAAMR